MIKKKFSKEISKILKIKLFFLRYESIFMIFFFLTPPDIAVGAPYDGPNGEGSVYIFNGNASGLVSRPSQVKKRKKKTV